MVFNDVNQEALGGLIKVDFSGDFPKISYIQYASSIPGNDNGKKLFELLSGKRLRSIV